MEEPKQNYNNYFDNTMFFDMEPTHTKEETKMKCRLKFTEKDNKEMQGDAQRHEDAHGQGD